MLLAVVAACSDDGEPAASVDVQVYSAVIRWFDADEPAMGDDERREVFLDGLDDATVDIDVQVDIVNALEDDMRVRFIDADDEAIDPDVEGAPVRNGGLLLHLGPVVVRDGGAEVDVGRYAGDGEVVRYRLSVVSGGGAWRVGGSPVTLPDDGTG